MNEMKGTGIMKEDANGQLLEVSGLNVAYGNLRVLFDVSVTIRKGEVVFLAGRNGAGKTTLFRTIAGFLTPTAGEIVYREQNLVGREAFQIALKGVKYIHQDKQVFSDLTVRENLELGSYATRDYDWDRVTAYVPKLRNLMNRKAGNLSGGEKQMLLIAMALLGKPGLVLMDEPTEGLAPHLITDLTAVFRELSSETTLFIVEQNLPLIAKIADRVYSMKEGKIVAETADRQAIESLAFEKYL